VYRLHDKLVDLRRTISNWHSMMRFPVKPLHFVLLFTLLTSIAGCQSTPQANRVADPWGDIQIGRTEPIRIAVITPLAYESVGGLGLDTLRGIELAIDQVGSIENRPIEIVNVQGLCNARGGRAAANAVAEIPQVVAILGPICSEACSTAASVYEGQHLTAISPNCGASSLTDEVLHNGAFMRTAYDDQREGEAAAEFAYRELGARAAATISDQTLDTVDAVAAFESAFRALGGKIVVSETTPATKGYYDPILEAIEAASADVVYAPLQPGDAALVTLQISSSPISDIALIGGRSYLTATYLDRAGIGMKRVYAVGPNFPQQGYDALLERYSARYEGALPESPQFAFAYDAALLMFRAIEASIVNGTDGGLLVGRQALRDTLYDTSSFEGVTGLLTCSSWGDCSAGSLAVYRAQDSEWTLSYVP
jgi:branched-chain amino acid transport system substrate-binding protein